MTVLRGRGGIPIPDRIAGTAAAAGLTAPIV